MAADWEEAAECSLPPAFDQYPGERKAACKALYRALDELGQKQRMTFFGGKTASGEFRQGGKYAVEGVFVGRRQEVLSFFAGLYHES